MYLHSGLRAFGQHADAGFVRLQFSRRGTDHGVEKQFGVRAQASGRLLREAREKKSRNIFVVSRDRETSLAMSLEMLRENPTIKVIWMLRNPLDVLTSTHANKPGEFYVEPERLIQSLELYRQFRNEPQVLTVRYEDLVSNPNAVQGKIAAAFNLNPSREFTEAHKHFPRFEENVRAMHSIRPVDAGSLDKWKKNPVHAEYLKKTLADFPAIIPLARDCGYEINL